MDYTRSVDNQLKLMLETNTRQMWEANSHWHSLERDFLVEIQGMLVQTGDAHVVRYMRDYHGVGIIDGKHLCTYLRNLTFLAMLVPYVNEE